MPHQHGNIFTADDYLYTNGLFLRVPSTLKDFKAVPHTCRIFAAEKKWNKRLKGVLNRYFPAFCWALAIPTIGFRPSRRKDVACLGPISLRHSTLPSEISDLIFGHDCRRRRRIKIMVADTTILSYTHTTNQPKKSQCSAAHTSTTNTRRQHSKTRDGKRGTSLVRGTDNIEQGNNSTYSSVSLGCPIEY